MNDQDIHETPATPDIPQPAEIVGPEDEGKKGKKKKDKKGKKAKKGKKSKKGKKK